MSKDHEGDIRQYIHLEEAWYAKSTLANADYVDEVMFGFYSPDGGTSGEMCMRWRQIRDGKLPSPRLECFSDAWHALAQFQDVIDMLAFLDGRDIHPVRFCNILESCGFTDNTPRDEKKRAELEAAYSKEEEQVL